jgi:hypothetical protein
LLATLCFALALLAKPFAAVALFAVLLFGWARSRGDGEAEVRDEGRWPWLAGWVAVLVGFAIVEAVAFSSTAGQAPALYADPWTRVCMMIAAAGRYLWMALTGTGLSVFHEPAPITTLLHPQVMASIVVLALVGWRLVVTLRRRSEESVYWIWALVSFGPLSGIVPLPYPIADRYLYFILPGLIGAALLAWPELVQLVTRRLDRRVDAATLARVGVGVGVAWALVFAVQAHARAGVWRSAETMMADSERNYPEGAAAQTRKAGRAARRGDFAVAVRHLEAAHARGYNRLDHILIDASYGPMQGYAPFVELKREMAREWVERLQSKATSSQVEARALAQAYVVLEDLEGALRVVEGAAAIPGPITDDLRADAAKLRAELARQERMRAHRERSAPPPDRG